MHVLGPSAPILIGIGEFAQEMCTAKTMATRPRGEIARIAIVDGLTGEGVKHRIGALQRLTSPFLMHEQMGLVSCA